jgi:hypothetical protein
MTFVRSFRVPWYRSIRLLFNRPCKPTPATCTASGNSRLAAGPYEANPSVRRTLGSTFATAFASWKASRASETFVSEEMERALEKERKKRMLDSVPETARVIISEYLAKNGT